MQDYLKLQTRLKELEAEIQNKEDLLIQIEKLSTIGQFIREIIHELKNPLSAISSYTELAIAAPTIEAKMKYLEKIPNGINKITQRLSQFRAMSFNKTSEFSLLDLNESLMQCLAALEILKPKGTNILSTFCKNKLLVFGDSDLWQQVFLSIVKVFFDRMDSNNPDLLIEGKCVSSEEILASQDEQTIHCTNNEDWLKSLTKTSSWVKIKIENDKLKISKQFIKNAFSENIGSALKKDNTVLGLIIASDIIKRHGGNISVFVPNGESLCLEIYVPSELEN